MANLECERYPLNSMNRMVATPEKERPRIFGGVANDLEWANGVPWKYKPFFLLDVPPSLIADVATIPEVLGKQAEWDKEPQNGEVKHPALSPDAASESN